MCYLQYRIRSPRWRIEQCLHVSDLIKGITLAAKTSFVVTIQFYIFVDAAVSDNNDDVKRELAEIKEMLSSMKRDSE